MWKSTVISTNRRSPGALIRRNCLKRDAPCATCQPRRKPDTEKRFSEALSEQACHCELRLPRGREVALFQIALYVFSKHIAFEVHGIARFAVADVSVFVGIRDNGDFSDVILPTGHGEADAVNRDRALLHDVTSEFHGDLYAKPPVFPFGGEVSYAADGIHVAEDEVPPEFLTGRERLFKIDACTFLQLAALCAERSLADCFTG